MRMLAERKIAVDVISHSQSQSQDDSSANSNVLGGLSGGINGGGGKEKGLMKPNEQNERNRAREVTFSGFIKK